jgi:phospholipase C
MDKLLDVKERWIVNRKALCRWLPIFCLVGFFEAEAPAATGTIRDVQHVVVLMQENRSFDHYFGSLSGVHGFNDRSALRFSNGTGVFYQPNGTNYVLPFHAPSQCLGDAAHTWIAGHAAWNNGKWDRWVPAKGVNTMAYFNRADLGFYYALAEAYTICDANHCSLIGGTHPNRSYLMTGTIDPGGTQGGPTIDNTVPISGFSWTTYPERLQNAGITWKVYQENDNFDCNVLAWFVQYQNAAPGTPLHDRGMARVGNISTAFQFDVTNGTLPQISWVITPGFLSEHPPASPSSGAQVIQKLLQALNSNPSVCNSTVLILTYDEEGGFFDHVPAPVPPPGTADEFVDGLPIGLGPRVPMIIISPWTRGGFVCSQVFDHTSVLRFLELWTGVTEPNLSAWRRQVAGDLTSAFNFAAPDYSLPVLPSLFPVNCSSNDYPPVPYPQSMPVQELGNRPARPLPYQPNATSSSDCGNNQFQITLTNSGLVSTHFSIYATAFRTDGPWQYDVLPGDLTQAAFTGIGAGGSYDFTCYGPNGFARRFAGTLATNCNQIEVTSVIDQAANAIQLRLRNSTAGTVTFTLTNRYAPGETWNYNVAPGTVIRNSFLAQTNRGGYDFAVTVSNDATFLRELAGHIETEALTLAVNLSSANLFLSYPSWAANYALESSTNLASGTWLPVDTQSTNIANRLLVTLPISRSAAYFRLKK